MSPAGAGGAWRLARAQAAWAPRALGWAACSIAVGTCALVLALALGRGLQRAGDAYLGAHLPTNAFDVVAPPQDLGAALWGGGPAEGVLDENAREALAALDGVREASAAVDLRLPLMAEGGAALLGRELRADLLVTGLEPTAAAPAAATPAFVAPFADDPNGPVPMVVHPGLLLTYNAAVAPSLGTPQLGARDLLGLRFYVAVGPSHLPGRVAVRRTGGFWAELVGLSEAAAPLGASVPRASAERLWRDYAAGSGPAPLARVRVVANDDAAVPRLQARARRLGLHVDDAAAAARGAVALARRLVAGLGIGLAALVVGYGAVALAGHWAAAAGDFALMGRLGHARRALLAAAALQGGSVGALGGAVGALGARWLAPQLQAALQRAAAPFGLCPPQAFVFAAFDAPAATFGLAVAAACGSVVALARRLDKAGAVA